MRPVRDGDGVMTFSERFTCRRCGHLIGRYATHWEVVPGVFWCLRCKRLFPAPCLLYDNAAAVWDELHTRTKHRRSPAAEAQPAIWEAMQRRQPPHGYTVDIIYDRRVNRLHTGPTIPRLESS